MKNTTITTAADMVEQAKEHAAHTDLILFHALTIHAIADWLAHGLSTEKAVFAATRIIAGYESAPHCAMRMALLITLEKLDAEIAAQSEPLN